MSIFGRRKTNAPAGRIPTPAEITEAGRRMAVDDFSLATRLIVEAADGPSWDACETRKAVYDQIEAAYREAGGA